jgi:hypothetical protein
VKRAYDPENLLRMNRNVRPHSATEACCRAAGALLSRWRII